jgi:uncharacterized membrane-anchored protein YitT (DUF2179 family)
VKKKILEHLVSLLLIAIGSTISGLAYAWFLLPHQVVPGGVSGIAMILNYFLGTPVGIVSILLNLPLFVLGIKVLGASYGVKSIVGMVLSSLMIDFFTYVVPLQPATSNVMLACIFGGLMLGAGLGLVFRGGGSTGGTDIVGQVLNRYTNLSTGTAILLADCVIILLAGLCYQNFELALYAFLNVYLQTRAIDLVIEGVSYTRAMWVVSDASNDISKAITQKMGRGATLLHATGAYTDARKDVVFIVMSKREVSLAREIVKKVDAKAFIIITDVYEVLGEGFRPRT